ncbi:MAG: hypothetical protein C4330_10640 [Chitinophagaceae bacterium]
MIYHQTYFTNPLYKYVGYTAAAILCCFFLEKFVYYESGISFIRKNAVLNYLGSISYAMYLVHMPVYLFLYLVKSKLGDLLLSAEILVFGITIIITIISRRFIEIPFLQLKKYFPKHVSSQHYAVSKQN